MGCAPGSLAGGGSGTVRGQPDGYDDEQTPRTIPVRGGARRLLGSAQVGGGLGGQRRGGPDLLELPADELGQTLAVGRLEAAQVRDLDLEIAALLLQGGEDLGLGGLGLRDELVGAGAALVDQTIALGVCPWRIR